MHELSIAQSIIQIVEKSLPFGFSKKISLVHLSIGTLSGIELDALTFAFSVIKKGTLLSGSEMEIEIINGFARCKSCNTEFELNSYGNPCPDCGSYSLNIIRGKEMKVTNIIVDD
jgi:hydrogenase nickel incorporation protein HypA/HybF